MYEKMQELLHSLKKKTVTLQDLEYASYPSCSYEDFAKIIYTFESKGVLFPIKSHGTNSKNPPLALGYRVRLHPLQGDLYTAITQSKIHFHPHIQLDAYFNLPFSVWKEDFPYLELIHSYLSQQSLPTSFAPAPERSFELVANEKWISELGGKELLERIQLWDKLLIIPVDDPMMFGINPKNILLPKQYHLIVENKTTYQALLPVLVETNFSTLIYGVGSKINKSIDSFVHQYPVYTSEHLFYYFGDIDFEGINIWYRLTQKVPVVPALPFYKPALTKNPPTGKHTQRRNEKALEQFTSYFPKNTGEQIYQSLSDGKYYPQEILTTGELQAIWRESLWITTK